MDSAHTQVDIFPDAESEKTCVFDTDEILRPDPNSREDPQADVHYWDFLCAQLCIVCNIFFFSHYKHNCNDFK